MTKDEALKLALEALNKMYSAAHDIAEPAITAIREALAQPQQEPVAYRSRLESGSYTYCNTAQFFDNAEPLYTSTPARKPLTNEEIEQCMKQAYSTAQGRLLEHAFARAIEAAHGIKENA